MGIWKYQSTKNTSALSEGHKCPFCEAKTSVLHELGTEDFDKYHYSDLPTYYSDAGSVNICRTCGWWDFRKTYNMASVQSISSMAIRAHAELYDFETTILERPLQELKDYLHLNYKKRFDVPGRKMEELVEDVFKNFGYKTELTAYQKDGGIDIYILQDGTRASAIQVKGTKNGIGVEQIRSFTGALYLKDLLKGVFVATSSFTKDAKRLVENEVAKKGMAIELMDAASLFDALQLQKSPAPTDYRTWLEHFGEHIEFHKNGDDSKYNVSISFTD